MTEWTVNNKLNEWYQKRYHIKLPKKWETKSEIYFSSGFSPSALFALAEPGVWYDPSDVANLAWRRNLLTWSEQFDNSFWVKQSGSAVTANQTTAPDGTTTADLVVGNGTSGIFVSAIPVSTITNNTKSIWLRGVSGGEVVALKDPSLTLGTTTCTLTTTWQRFSLSEIQTTGIAGLWVANIPAGGIYIWGAQLEAGSLTDYQRITDVNTEVIERFPNATLYQDVAGTIPVTGPTNLAGNASTVALMLDKSRGLTLGTELVTNGDFSGGTTGWLFEAGWAIASGVATGTATGGFLYQNTGSIAQGKYYDFTFTVTNFAGGSIQPFVGSSPVFGTAASSNGTFTRRIFLSASSGQLGLKGASFTGSIDNISIKEIQGFHATQATAASRPIYGVVPQGGRRNLLEYTDQLDNAYWIKNNITVSANATTSPDGTNTADLIYATATSTTALVSKILSTSSSRQTQNWYVKAAGRSIVWMSLDGGADITYFNLATQAVTPSGNHNAVITPLANDWFDISISNKVATGYSWVGTIGICDVVGSPAVVVNGTNGIYVTGGQRELSATATARQRVTTTYDVTEAGVPSCSYLFFDGGSDSMATGNIDFTATDKMTVWAGVRKNSDASAGVVAELSVSVSTNNGSFLIDAPDIPASQDYGFYVKGTSISEAQANGFPAPDTAVLAMQGDIAASSDRIRARRNGSQVGTSGAASLGTGNFGNYPLYIGARAGTGTFFNGNLFGLVVRGAASTTAQITATEAWLAPKTGVTL
jgi:hypothetical protein